MVTPLLLYSAICLFRSLLIACLVHDSFLSLIFPRLFSWRTMSWCLGALLHVGRGSSVSGTLPGPLSDSFFSKSLYGI